MNANGFDDTTQELLRAAERSLFDATVRLEEALAALDGRGDADAQAVLAQVRRWSEMINAGLDRFSPPSTLPVARPAVARASKPQTPGRARTTYVPCSTVAKA